MASVVEQDNIFSTGELFGVLDPEVQRFTWLQEFWLPVSLELTRKTYQQAVFGCEAASQVIADNLYKDKPVSSTLINKFTGANINLRPAKLSGMGLSASHMHTPNFLASACMHVPRKC